jgi:class 3 adenylate cyclase
MRHLVVASLDLFDEFEGSPPQRMRRGMTVEEAVEPSLLQGGMMNLLLPWLRERHMEHEVFERIVSFTERSLSRAGRMPARPDDPPAIAFVDLAGYTERTVQAGDELAARDAAALQALAQEAAVKYGGRVVKLLGDGVMLRFASAGEAVAGVRALMAAILQVGLPPPHAGIAAGRFVVRDGDVFGHTVNLASRIAAHSQSGELLVPADVVEGLRGAGIRSEDAGVVQLKGIGEPLRLARILT